MAEEGVENPKPKRRKAKPKAARDEEVPLAETTSSKAKLRVDQVLQEAVAQSTKDAVEAKKKKKKKVKSPDDHVLESLRKAENIEGLHKAEDSAILANTFDPDNNVKNEKSNKQRQRRRDKNQNADGEGQKQNKEEAAVEEGEVKKKKKVPKKKEQFIEDEIEKELGLITEPEPPKPEKKPRVKVKSPKSKSPEVPSEPSVVEEKEEDAVTPAPEAAPRKKKKKKVKTEESEEAVDDTKNETEEAEKVDEKLEEEEKKEETTATKKKKKKKKADKEAEEKAAEAEEEEPPDIQDLGEVMALHIHRTDKLKTDFHILHPLVRVHVVNEETGQYIPKQHMDRAVTSFFETSNEAVKSILPMMTQPFNFKEKRSTLPVWEDLLVFNENFNYFIQPNPKVLLLFELLDFVSMNTASRQFSNQKEEGGWHRIAWAFLKVLGKNGKVNVGNKVRLQLYLPGGKGSREAGQPEVFHWWKSGQRIPYPSTLYVTLKSIDPPKEVAGATRSMFATQKESGHMTYKDLKTMTWSNRDRSQEGGGRTLTTWSRLFGQLCRVPNTLSLTLPAGKKGCFVIKFSHDGRNLACACKEGTDYPIFVYEIPSGNLKGQFQGHFGIIYSLSWSRSDTQLLTASSDGTVRVWDIQNFGETQTCLLPHPGFVYTAEFHPRVDSIVVSGGYDEVIRVWDISVAEGHGMLQQEMEEHHGHINSICFDNDDGQKMYSADSVGVIIIWNVFVTEQVSRKHFVRDWTKYQDIKDSELKDKQINFIQMHPSGRRLMVHGRNNTIFMFDLRVHRVMQKYFGAENSKEKICSTITPCGSFVFSGSEDGKLYAWNTDTGDQVAVYTQLNYQMPVTDVHYHPRDHMVAMCSLGDNHPIYVYMYDPLIAHVDASSPRPMSPVETTDVEDLETARSSALKDLNLASVRSKVMSKEEFETLEKTRYQRIMKKLESATMQMSMVPPGAIVPENLYSTRMDSIGRSGIQSTWKQQFDTSYALTPRSAGTAPGVLSPHAPPGPGAMLASQISSHRGYMRSADGDWRPGFSEVGRHGNRSQSPTFYGRPPHLSLSTSMGKPQFTFESSVGKTARQNKVIAMYDYKAQRSDELNLYRGDVIMVLYKDNENWWMGELQDGQQGFFPSNYVTEDEDAHWKKRGKTPSVSSGSSITAVKTKSGELRFVSGGEESDMEAPRRRKKNQPTVQLEKPKPTSESKELEDLLNEYESMA